ncbi:endonuclease/exonuclease/phosphatase family protein [Trifolium medium]|uniref:Endonuclease/exonuclease/phosphatase family protein n=1 Tax=Trifolium medium TaxID=97028 RepID=A0A392M646_9FABA|nr:endonuclease/exonuclease/phosphatase family protein [Trifolium medium]
MEVNHPIYPKWRLTGFYGYPDSGRRQDSWDLLRTLAQDNSLPWCIMGDFNDLLSNDDKRSSVDHPPWRIRGFRSAVQDSNLVDLPLIGYPFTWIRSRSGEEVKEERLDRALVTQAWYDMFPNCQLHNVVADRSDHYPILLKLFEGNRKKIMREFKFENSWLQEDDLERVVQEGWNKGVNGEVMSRLQCCTEEMNEWGRQLRNKYRVEIEDCRKELEMLRTLENHVQGTRYEEVRKKMSLLLAQEETFWKQRAKIYWLREGDTNSRFFHATASAKKRRNEINKLQNEAGEVVQQQHEMCDIAKTYFEKLFSSSHRNSNMDLRYIEPCITEAQNDQLLSPFQVREIKEALFSMHSDKAPGPDGLNPTFY